MIISAADSAVAISSACWFHRQKVSLDSGFSGAFVSAPRRNFPSISILYPIQKHAGHKFQHIDFPGRVSANAEALEVISDDAADAPTQKLDAPKSSRPRTLKKERNPKRLNSSAPQIKKVNNFPVLRYPLGTESAIKAMSDSNTLVFVVDKRADKTNIKEEVKMMFKVRAKKVNTSITPDGTKKAFIMLAPEFKASDVAKKIGIF